MEKAGFQNIEKNFFHSRNLVELAIYHLPAEDSSQSAAIPRLALKFPNVTIFSVICSAMFVYINLWKFCPGLRILDVTHTVSALDVNLNALFCGISTEELNWMKEKADG